MKTIVMLGVIWGLLLPVCGLAQPDRSEEIRQLTAGIESPSWARRVESAKIISRAGLQDPALYQKIAALLKSGYSRAPDNDHTDEMSWMCKALAASGDPAYRTLLDEIAANAPSKKLRKYAGQSSQLIEQYARRSQILNANSNWDAQLSAQENRLVNMLKSDDIGLRRDAAKAISRTATVHAKVFSVTASTLTGMLEDFESTNLYVDTMAWLCKALASSHDGKYAEALDNVIDTTHNSKLRAYAIKARNKL